MRRGMATRSEPFVLWRFLRALLPYAGILLAAAAFTWASRLNHLQQNRDLEAREVRLKAEIGDLEEEVRVLRHRLEGMRNDPYVVESRVRQRFGYLRPGEKVIEPEEERREP